MGQGGGEALPGPVSAVQEGLPEVWDAYPGEDEDLDKELLLQPRRASGEQVQTESQSQRDWVSTEVEAWT